LHGNDHRDLMADQILGQAEQPIRVPFRPAVFDNEVAALNKASFGQTAVKRCERFASAIERSRMKIADHGKRRLRPRRKRPRRRASQPSDEFPPSHRSSSR
jgi:hypothetical protein